MHVLAALPFSHGDEPCCVVHAINNVIAGRGEGITAALRHHMDTPNGRPSDGHAQQVHVAMTDAQLAESDAGQLQSGIANGVEVRMSTIGDVCFDCQRHAVAAALQGEGLVGHAFGST